MKLSKNVILKYVFKCLLKVAVEVVSRSDCGRLFHALGPVTEKVTQMKAETGHCNAMY